MATLTQLQTWLTAAETAYNDLVTGTKARVVVDQNGERVEYFSTNASKLSQYIESLKRQINGYTDRPQGPAKVWIA